MSTMTPFIFLDYDNTKDQTLSDFVQGKDLSKGKKFKKKQKVKNK
jgi:hypothetical protein